MTPAEAIRLLRERERAATPGPWATGVTCPVDSCGSDNCLHDSAGKQIGQVTRWDNDADLIAKARTALPALLDVAEAAGAVIAAREAIEAAANATILALENAAQLHDDACDRLSAALAALAKAVQ